MANDINNIIDFVDCSLDRLAPEISHTTPQASEIWIRLVYNGYTESLALDVSKLRIGAREAFDYLDMELRKFKERAKTSEVKPDAETKNSRG